MNSLGTMLLFVKNFFLSHFMELFINGVFEIKHFIKLMCHLYIMAPLEGSGLMPDTISKKNEMLS